MDWDGASGATMIFKNSYGHMGNVWSHWNVGIYNVPSGQTLNFNLVKLPVGKTEIPTPVSAVHIRLYTAKNATVFT